MDTFHGHYKDDTNGTMDYRFFPAVLPVLIVTFRMYLHASILYVTLYML